MRMSLKLIYYIKLFLKSHFIPNLPIFPRKFDTQATFTDSRVESRISYKVRIKEKCNYYNNKYTIIFSTDSQMECRIS